MTVPPFAESLTSGFSNDRVKCVRVNSEGS